MLAGTRLSARKRGLTRSPWGAGLVSLQGVVYETTAREWHSSKGRSLFSSANYADGFRKINDQTPSSGFSRWEWNPT